MSGCIVLTTGGTGGHIFPALAVAEELRRLAPETDLHFVGGDYGPEGDLARKAGLAFTALPARGVIGRGLKALAAVGWISRSLLKALGLFSRIKPAAVAGFGGYAAFCPLLAAALTGRPTLLHEQNSVPGMVNRVLAKVVRRVCVSFPDDANRFPAAKVVRTGNPVRAAVRALRDAEPRRAEAPWRVLVVGGSQGSAALNRAVTADLSRLSALSVELRHQTGPRETDAVRAAYAEQNADPQRAVPFIENMAAAYAWADVVVCRAGASTLAELTVAGKAALLVPFPHATHDHQRINAKSLEARGAAVVCEESVLAEQGLAQALEPLLNADTLTRMAASARAMGRPDAAEAVAREILDLAGAPGRSMV